MKCRTKNQTEQPIDNRIAVIGGGISGLACAIRLTQVLPDCSVTLFDRQPQMGGSLKTDSIDGFLIEQSADMFSREPGFAVQLCREIGFDDQLISPKKNGRRAFVVKDQTAYPVPEGLALMSPYRIGPVLRSSLMSWRGKFRFCMERLVRRRNGAEGDESLASFATRRFGKEAFERIIQPLVGGIYSADANKLSMAATLNRYLQQEQKFGSLTKAAQSASRASNQNRNSSGARYNIFTAPRHGMASLVAHLVRTLKTRGVKIQTNTDVTGFESLQDRTLPGSSNRFLVKTQRTTTPGVPTPDMPKTRIPITGSELDRNLLFDGLVLACKADVCRRLLLDSSKVHSENTESSKSFSQLADELGGFEFASMAIVAFGGPRAKFVNSADETASLERLKDVQPQNGFGIVVPEIEGKKTIAASFSSNKFEGRAPDGEFLVRCFVGGAKFPEATELDDRNLIELAANELQQIMKCDLSDLQRANLRRVYRWKNAMPQYHVGHLDRVDRIEKLVASLSNIELAGASYRGVGIPACIESGNVAADRLVHKLRSRLQIRKNS